jgi:hypothetical protein
MWEKIKTIKKTRTGEIYRFVCKTCGKEVDSGKTPKNCKHSNLYNIDSVWGNILRSALGIKSGRKRLDIDIDRKFIEKLFLKQNGKCALSGRDITLGLNASLDRIDSSNGYTKNNVQWLHKDINIIKGSLEEKYFLEICENVYKHNRKSN